MKRLFFVFIICFVIAVLLIGLSHAYVINRDTCIGCMLCIPACPVDAIGMFHGKAVIDTEKCISCGICKYGDRTTFNGCPVKAADLTSHTMTGNQKDIAKEENKEQLSKDIVSDSKDSIKIPETSEKKSVSSQKQEEKQKNEVVVSEKSKTETMKTTEIKEDTNLTAEKNIVKKIIYLVKENCIGCQLCVSNCPVRAITMKDNKAVIDTDKCIGCGICANGNNGDFAGCPVKAIEKSEK